MPSRSDRNATGLNHSPKFTYGTSANACCCTASARAKRCPGSFSNAKASRSCSISGSHGQPNHARSRHPPLVTTLASGCTTSMPMNHVGKMFQPFSSGGASSARRLVSVLQSIAWSSTFTPASRRTPASISAAPLRIATSVGCIRTTGRPS